MRTPGPIAMAAAAAAVLAIALASSPAALAAKVDAATSAHDAAAAAAAHAERVSRTAAEDWLAPGSVRALTGGAHEFLATAGAMYSGFLAVGGENEGGALHYFFAESAGDPATDPLVLWLNGGPGGSSFGGSILEHGPLILNRTGTGLMENPWAWSNVANVIFLESPPGVGFSYCAAQLEDPSVTCYADDYTAAEANLDALRSFLMKFPEFIGREFYITGESYGGVYVPTLSKLLYDSDLAERGALDFQGFAVGDPCTDNDLQGGESGFSAAFALRHGVLSEEWYNLLTHCIDMPESGLCKEAREIYALAKGGYDGAGLFDEYNVRAHESARRAGRFTPISSRRD